LTESDRIVQNLKKRPDSEEPSQLGRKGGTQRKEGYPIHRHIFFSHKEEGIVKLYKNPLIGKFLEDTKNNG